MRKTALTERQKQLLGMICQFIKDTGYPPSFEEMKNSLNVVSNQSIIDLLSKLENQKLIKRGEDQARGIVILPFSYETLGQPPLVPFLGISHAGAPIQTIEVYGEWEQLPGNVAQLKDQIFLLKVVLSSVLCKPSFFLRPN